MLNFNQIHIGSRTVLLTEDVAYFEAIGNYTKVYLQSNKYLLSSTTLGIIEKRAAFSGLFIRANRSTLINTSFVKEFDLESVMMQNSSQIKMSRRRREDVIEKLKCSNPFLNCTNS